MSKNNPPKKLGGPNHKRPNMDLIEDVSRASQNLTNELINTNTGFHDMTGFNIIHTEEEANVQHIIMLT